MKKVIWKGMLAALLLASNGVHAQYDELLKPQPAGHAEMMKKNKYLRVIMGLRSDAAGAEMPTGVMYYDAEGRLERSVTKPSKKTYTYDAEGRVSAILDSAHDGRRYVKVEYAFTYGPDGRLVSMRKDKAVSTFTYDVAGHLTAEECTVNGQPSFSRQLTYNADNKVVRDERRMAGATEAAEATKYVYNKYGEVTARVLVVNKGGGVKDSTVNLFTYDGQGRLINKRITNATLTADPANPAAPATSKINKTESFGYTYNMKGQLGKETYTSNVASESYVLEYEIDNTGVPMSELKKSPSGQFMSKLTYSYYKTK